MPGTQWFTLCRIGGGEALQQHFGVLFGGAGPGLLQALVGRYAVDAVNAAAGLKHQFNERFIAGVGVFGSHAVVAGTQSGNLAVQRENNCVENCRFSRSSRTFEQKEARLAEAGEVDRRFASEGADVAQHQAVDLHQRSTRTRTVSYTSRSISVSSGVGGAFVTSATNAALS